MRLSSKRPLKPNTCAGCTHNRDIEPKIASDWLFGDQQYLIIWTSLMSECVRRKIKITIIHNIDRDLSEMVSAIENWMPLYMSGMIEPYFCRKKTDGRFAHTLFLCPGISCITACHVKGCEGIGKYDYVTDEKSLSILSDEFDYLLSPSEPLLRVYPINKYNSMLFSVNSAGKNCSSLANTLSIATMPESLINLLCERYNLSLDEKALLCKTWKEKQNEFMRYLEAGIVSEFVPVPSDDDLFKGHVFSSFNNVIESLKITYTAEEYTLHIKNIIDLLETYSNYRLYPLPESPFTGMEL